MVKQNEMAAFYLQAQYMQYMNAMYAHAQMAQIKKFESPAPKKTPTVFTIEAILSENFGPKLSKNSEISSSRSTSPVDSQFSDVESVNNFHENNSTSKIGITTSKKYATSRGRTIYTDVQLEKLERKFRENQYLVGDERVNLAEELGLQVKQIKIWFQNRRIKQRRRTTRNSVCDSE